MPSFELLPVALGLAAALAWGSADFLVARLGGRVGERRVFAVAQPAGAVALLAVVALAPGADLGGVATPPVLGLGVLGALATLALYTALRLGPVSVTSPVGATYGAVAALLAVTLGDEQLLALGAAGVLAITAGVVLVSADPERVGEAVAGPESVRPGLAVAAVAALGLGATNFLLDPVAATAGPIATLLGIRLVGSAMGTPFLAGGVPRDALPALAVVGVLDAGAFAAYVYGTTVGRVAVVAPVASLFALVTIALARVVLGERLTRTQRAGVLLVLAGTPMLAAV